MEKDYKKLVRIAARNLYNKQAENVFIYDVRNVSPFFDWVLVATGKNETHLRALLESLVEEMEKNFLSPHHIEGEEGKRWVVIDYKGFVVHIFLPEVRRYYEFDRIFEGMKKLRFVYRK
ncbi:MAG: ribosome silencing factor [Caldiserica bacterium]|nr:MAG: ribosome silencing factor [Caldisericota bacterium]